MSKVLKKIRENGLRTYLRWRYIKIYLKKLSPKYQKLFVFEQLLSEPLHHSKPQIDVKFKIKKNVDEIKTLIEQREDWYPAAAAKRFKDGNLCFVAEYDEKIVSCVWTSFDEVYLPNVEYTLKVEKDIVPLIDGWTSPAFRGKGLYNFVWNGCLNYLKEQKRYTRIYGFIVPKNKISLIAHKRINLNKVIMIITLIKIFGIRFHRVTHIRKSIDELMNL